MTYTILGIIALAILAPVAFTFFIARRVTKEFSPEGKFINIGGNRVYYTDRGTSPAIVFVHGLCSNLRNFAHLDLDRLTRSYHVVVIDRPDTEWSVRGGDSPANICAQTRVITQCIEQLGLGKPVLVGHSLGGAISLAIGLNHPHVIRRLALTAPPIHTESTPPGVFGGLVLTPPLTRRLVSWTLVIPLSIINPHKAVVTVFAPEAMPKDFPFKGGGLLGLCLHMFYAASSDLVTTPEDLPNMERRYAPMTVPVDVLYGRGGRILNVKCQDETLKRRLDRVNLRVIDGGRMLPVMQPVLTTDWVLAIAARIPVKTETLA